MSAGLTQEELAERAGVSARSVSDLERGLPRVSYPHTLRRLAEALGLSVDECRALQKAAGQRASNQAAGSREALSDRSPAVHLPVDHAPFVGREGETLEIVEALSRLEVRLLTLTGSGGVGKTRLAIAAARSVHDDFDDVYFVPLAAVAHSSLVPATIATAVGLQLEIGDNALEAIVRQVGARRVLLVLDNFEHLLDSSSTIVTLLGSCPELKVLVTSREILHLYGEHDYIVPPLQVPQGVKNFGVETLDRYDATRLFVQRARATDVGFKVTASSAPIIAEICRRLDGLPLAIELAAARVRLFSPELLLARLDDRLSVLSAGARNLAPRQQTLRATMEWSFNLLEPPERRLFAYLSVFVGGCSWEAIEDVCGRDGEQQINVLQGMALLVDKSMVWQMVHAGTDGPRFSMLTSIREYAVIQLEALYDDDHVRDRHAEYFLAVAESGGRRIWGKDQARALASLEQDHENLRAAFAWLMARDQVELAARLAIGTFGLFLDRGHAAEGRAWCEEILSHQERLSRPVRAQLLLTGAWFATDPDESVKWTEEGIRLWRELSRDDHGPWTGTAFDSLAGPLAMLAQREQSRGNHSRARQLSEESIREARAHEDENGLAVALSFAGQLALRQGDLKGASQLEEALPLVRNSSNTGTIAWCLIHLASLLLLTGDTERAEDLAEEALVLEEEIRNPFGVALARQVLLAALVDRGASSRARGILFDLIAAVSADAHLAAWQIPLQAAAIVAVTENNHERAARFWGAAESLRESYGGVSPVFIPQTSGDPLHVDEVDSVTGARGHRIYAGDLDRSRDTTLGRADDRYRSLARARLGEDGWNAAFDAGRGMTPQAVVASVREQYADPSEGSNPSGTRV